MKTAIIVAASLAGVYIIFRALHAAANNVSPVAALIHPTLPIIAPKYTQTRRGVGHF